MTAVFKFLDVDFESLSEEMTLLRRLVFCAVQAHRRNFCTELCTEKIE